MDYHITMMSTNQVISEVGDDVPVGNYTGQTKWFNDKLGYGFITIVFGDEIGKDIFVHHSGIKPLNSNYKTLKKGEYINFSIINGDNGLQAINVTGICGGSLMCDVLPSKQLVAPMQVDPQGFSIVVPRRPHVHRHHGSQRSKPTTAMQT